MNNLILNQTARMVTLLQQNGRTVLLTMVFACWQIDFSIQRHDTKEEVIAELR